MMIVPGSAFIPKAASGGDPYWANVVLLMHMDGVGGSTVFVDETGKTVTAHGGVQHTTAQSVFGGSSGAGFVSNFVDRLAVQASADFSFPGDYTIEAFVNTSSAGPENCTLLDLRSGGGGVYSVKNSTSRRIVFWHSSDGSSPDIGSAYPLSVWFHVAFVRSGTTLTAYLDGVSQWSMTSATTTNSSTAPAIGNGYQNDWAGALRGAIDELRITKGVARYTTDFTPTTAPFPNY